MSPWPPVLSATVLNDPKSIHRRLQKAALISRKRPSRLQLRARHKEARMTWAMSHCHWRSLQWKRVVWSDEASFHLKKKDSRLRVWVRAGEKAKDRFSIPRMQSAYWRTDKLSFLGKTAEVQLAGATYLGPGWAQGQRLLGGRGQSPPEENDF